MVLEDMTVFLAELFGSLGVEHAVIGGWALSLYGHPRATKDIDVIVMVRPDDVSRVLDAIEARGLKISRKESVFEKLTSGRPAKIIWDKKFSFDLRLARFSIDSEAIKNAIRQKIFGVHLMFAGPEEIIVYKLARFDGLDQNDIRFILKTQAKSLDWALVEKLAPALAKESGIDKIMDNLLTISLWMEKYKNK